MLQVHTSLATLANRDEVNDMDVREQFLFDLQGFLLVKNFLSETALYLS